MSTKRATTVQQRHFPARLAKHGRPYQIVANQTDVSVWTARRWAWRAKKGGLATLLTHFSRPVNGPMTGSDLLIGLA